VTGDFDTMVPLGGQRRFFVQQIGRLISYAAIWDSEAMKQE
jgi:hypothetical protein